jgi:hypothetical protein
MAKAMHPTPMLDALESWPWPSFTDTGGCGCSGR